MRARNIKPGLYKNDKLAKLPALARILFTGLWCYADCEGKFEWNPDRIKVEILPYDKCNIEHLLMSLHEMTFIYRYQVDGQTYGIIPKFLDHQNPHPHEAKSKIPNPPSNILQEIQCHGMSATSNLPVNEMSAKSPADIMNPDIMNPDIRKGNDMSLHREVYDYYISKINPLQKSSKRALKNIQYWLKTFTAEELQKAADNYFTIAQNRESDKRKDPANFYGKQDEYFKDYLPEIFKPPTSSDSKDPFNDPYYCKTCRKKKSIMSSRSPNICLECEQKE